jgi:hypothetical protein
MPVNNVTKNNHPKSQAKKFLNYLKEYSVISSPTFRAILQSHMRDFIEVQIKTKLQSI